MENLIITKEMMVKAKTYMPLSLKEEIAHTIAVQSIQPMKTAEQNRPADTLISLPMMNGENLAVRAACLVNTFLGFYFDIEIEQSENFYAEYDRLAGAHLLNQIERFKTDKDVKDKAYDLLADYREFVKMVDMMIADEKANANDPLGRLSATIALLSTPENIRILAEELKKTTDKMSGKAAEAKKIG